jgi:hypothetical protein
MKGCGCGGCLKVALYVVLLVGVIAAFELCGRV